jgi:AcrR family transcriptional regulator
VRADAERNRARILAAAEEVFAEQGATASTDEVASRAGLAIGTVFRHFPTKDDLLRAIMKNLLTRLVDEVGTLADADGGTAFYRFFASLVAEAAAKQAVVELLGFSVDSLDGFTDAVGRLLASAQAVGTVRADVAVPETMALLTSTVQGALHGGWDSDLQQRTLDIVFAGFRPPS